MIGRRFAVETIELWLKEIFHINKEDYSDLEEDDYDELIKEI